MAVFWVLLIVSASSSVSAERLLVQNSSKMIFAMPVLFSAFGYHNIIPSLCSYMKKDRAVLRASIIIGTAIPFVVYLVWQWVIIGGVDQALIVKALKEGKPATEVLKEITAKPWIALLGKYFALLAISTSVLGVSFSILDFLKDGFNSFKMKASRAFLTFLVFFPPLVFCLYDPQIFDKALGIAGGIGEALLNGLIPVIFVYLLRYKMKRDFAHEIGGGKIALALIAVISIFVMVIEIIYLCSSCL